MGQQDEVFPLGCVRESAPTERLVRGKDDFNYFPLSKYIQKGELAVSAGQH
jgi:hypothetical protein